MSRPAWLQVTEKGSVLGIVFFLRMLRWFGRRMTHGMARPLVLYYVAAYRSVRRDSSAYLRRMGLPSGFWDVYRHLLRFAQCLIDRFLLLQGRDGDFAIERHGHDLVMELRSSGRGAIMLGAHLGSFEVMRAQANAFDAGVNVVGNFSNARMLNSVLDRVSPDNTTRLIDLSAGPLDSVFQIREAVERGEIVAILGDRVGPDGKTVTVPFLGDDAPFPVGVYILAAVLRCPVYLVFGLFRGGNRYDLYCEPFADQVVLPRKGRAEALEESARRYAARLEHYCRMAPDNWFNFFEFWSAP